VAKKVVTKKNRRKIRKTLGLIAGLTKTPSIAREFRGFKAEEKALKAAKYWKKKKIIRGVRQTEGLSLEDREMIDLVLTLLNGREVPVQVKNYCSGLVVEKCRERGVLLFSIWHNEDEEIAKERMLNLIVSCYFSELTPLEIRQVISKIWEIKQLAGPVKKPNLIVRILSYLRKVFS
jgi:hypothetical protein